MMSQTSYYFENSLERGFGTYPLRGDKLISAVEEALKVGYRAFDTAQMYGNEAELGQVLGKSGLDDIRITTKVHPNNFDDKVFLSSVEKSLKDLAVEKIDVLLLHWPPTGSDIIPPLKLLQEAHKRGLCSHVGVSNYNSVMMAKARSALDIPIVTNQVEFHPLLDQTRLLAASVETGIPLSSYCSLARGRFLSYPLFDELAANYNKTPNQIVLRWILQKGVAVNVMSTNPGHIRTNFDILNFTLSSIDIARIDKLNEAGYRIVTLDVSPWAPEWD